MRVRDLRSVDFTPAPSVKYAVVGLPDDRFPRRAGPATQVYRLKLVLEVDFVSADALLKLVEKFTGQSIAVKV